MATRKIVPRADNEGGIGTALKQWASGWIKVLTVTTINALTLAAQTVGFTIAGGTTSKTLTVDETVSVSDKATLSQGSFTVALACGTSGTITLGAGVSGSYTKIGRVVFFLVFVSVTSVSSPVGRLTMTGFPFTAGVNKAISVVLFGGLNSGYGTQIIGNIEVGDTKFYLDRYNDGTQYFDTAAAFKAGSFLGVTGFYFT